MNAPVANLLPQDISTLTAKEAVQLGATNLILFGRLFHSRTLRMPSPRFHYDMGLALYSDRRYQGFEIYRGGAKTSLLRVFNSQRIAYGISHTVQYISSSQEHSKFSVRWMRRQIMYNKKLAETFQLEPEKPWTDEIAVIKNCLTGELTTLMALGVTGQVRGFNPDDYRPDLIICDDVLTDENARTEIQRQKINDLVFGAIYNSLAPATECPEAKMVISQTPLAKGDVINVAKKDPAFHVETYGCFDESGNSRWPEREPLATLKAEKEAATRKGLYATWMREKECQIVAGEQQPLNSGKFRFYDVLPERFDDIVMAIDPASSDDPKAADTAIGVVGCLGTDYYVLEYYADIGMMPDAVSFHFFKMGMFWRPRKLIVESVAYQRILAWYLEREMALKRFFVVVDQIQDRRRKDDRILQDFGSELHTGHMFIKPSMQELITQCDDYIPGEDCKKDLVDMLSMAIVGLNPTLRSIVGGDDPDHPAIEMSYKDDEYYDRGNWRGAP